MTSDKDSFLPALITKELVTGSVIKPTESGSSYDIQTGTYTVSHTYTVTHTAQVFTDQETHIWMLPQRKALNSNGNVTREVLPHFYKYHIYVTSLGA